MNTSLFSKLCWPGQHNFEKRENGGGELCTQDGGPGGCALALGRWENDPVLAMRWNGDNDTNPIGNPQSRGLPTWFIIPEAYQEPILGTLRADQLTLARNFLPKPKR